MEPRAPGWPCTREIPGMWRRDMGGSEIQNASRPVAPVLQDGAGHAFPRSKGHWEVRKWELTRGSEQAHWSLPLRG